MIRQYGVDMAMSSDGYSRDFPTDDNNWDNQRRRYGNGWQNGPENDRRLFDDPVDQRPGFSDDAYGRDGYGNNQSWEDFERGESGFGGRGEGFGPQGYQPQYSGEESTRGQDDFEDVWRGRYDLQNDFERRQQQHQWRQQQFGQREPYQEDGRVEQYFEEPRPPYARQEYPQQDFGREYPGGESYYEAENDYFEGNRVQQYEPRTRRQPEYEPSQRREQEQRRPNDIARGDSFGFKPGFGAIDRMMDRVMHPFAGFGMMDRMMDEFTNPFPGFGMMDRMMDKFGSEMQANSNQDQDSMEELLDDAHNFLLADPAVADVLGEGIRLGPPFARSSSSAIINGARRSLIQLGVPVTGSRGAGSLRLLANEEGISRMEVDVNDRVIGVPVGAQRAPHSRKFGGRDIIDAEVVVEDDDEITY